MRDWYFAINSLPEYRSGSVKLVDQPGWLGALERFASWVCWKWLHRIPLPGWLYIERDGQRYSWSDYYGDIGCCVHLGITNPILQWVWRHPKRQTTLVELGYDRVRELFYKGNEEFFESETRLDEEDEA